MYVPESFQESDVAVQQEFIERNSFGLLVSHHLGSPFATHLPVVLDRTQGSQGTLLGHMAKANPQWKHFANEDCLVVFSGPHSYISPTWYEADNMVPTWNYVAVHAYGKFELVEDQESVLSILRRSVDTYERKRPGAPY